MKHIAKFTLIAFLVSLSLSSCGNPKTQASSMLSPEQLLEKKEELILIDVRTPEEYAAGHIENAVNINISDSNFKTEIQELDKTKGVAVYCKVGGRSATAAKMLKEMGFEQVYDLEGGILNWEESGMQTVK